jgi:hypothetical protein
MSDEVAKQFESQKQEEQVPSPSKSFTILITMQPDGNIEVTGPLVNDILCYGMLEKARCQIQKLHLISEQKRAQAKHGGIDGLLKRMNGGS